MSLVITIYYHSPILVMPNGDPLDRFFYSTLMIDFYNIKNILDALIKYVLKRVSFGSKDCNKELKLECAHFLGQTS